MHASYLSLALLAVGATAAPSRPTPGGKDAFGSFPFMPMGPSGMEDEDNGFENPVPAAMEAMQMAESVQASSYHAKAQAAQSTSAPAAPAATEMAPVAQRPEPSMQRPATAPAVATPTAAAKEDLIPEKGDIFSGWKEPNNEAMPASSAIHSNPIPAMGNLVPSLPMPVAASPTSHAIQATPMSTQAPVDHMVMQSQSMHMSFSTHVVAFHPTHAMARPSKASATPGAAHGTPSSSASASASASPTPSKAASPLGPLGGLLGGLPLFSGLLGRR